MTSFDDVSLSYNENTVHVRVDVDPEKSCYESWEIEKLAKDAIKEKGYSHFRLVYFDVKWPAISNQVWIICKLRTYNKGYL